MEAFPTRANIRLFLTRANIRLFPTRTNIRLFPTRANIRLFPTHANIRLFPTRANIRLFSPSFAHPTSARPAQADHTAPFSSCELVLQPPLALDLPGNGGGGGQSSASGAHPAQSDLAESRRL